MPPLEIFVSQRLAVASSWISLQNDCPPMNEMMAPEMDNRLIYIFLKLYTVALYPPLPPFTPRSTYYLPQKSFMQKNVMSHVSHQCNYGDQKMPPMCLFHTQMRGQLWSPHVCQWYNRCERGWPGSENYQSFILIRAFK